MGRHVNAIGQKRHRSGDETGGDLHAHEQGGDDGGEAGAALRAVMAVGQKHVVAGPDAVGVAVIRVVDVGMIVGVRHCRTLAPSALGKYPAALVGTA